MILTNELLLDNVVHGTPSGNYDGSSLAFTSNPVIAANYYGGVTGSTQTMYIRTTDFVGRIVLEATLNDGTTITGALAAWFEIGRYEAVTPRTDYHPITVVGNFTYIRARVELFEAGTIDSVTVTY